MHNNRDDDAFNWRKGYFEISRAVSILWDHDKLNRILGSIDPSSFFRFLHGLI